MSTGAPLNLPKPKATTNTGQDMIQLASSLQTINDAIKNMQANIGIFNSGSVNMGAVVSGETKTITVPYPRTFGKLPIVTVTANATVRPDFFAFSVNATSLTSFELTVRPETSSESLWVYWIAIERT